MSEYVTLRLKRVLSRFVWIVAFALPFSIFATDESARIRPVEIAQRISFLERVSISFDGPNCFNTALFALGIVNEIREVYSWEVYNFLFVPESRRVLTISNHHRCVPVNLNGPEHIEFGDLAVIAKADPFGQNLLAHAFVFLDDTTVFEKQSVFASAKPGRKSFDQAVSPYWPYSNLRTPESIGCRPGAILEYQNQNAYRPSANSTEAACEIFRCFETGPERAGLAL